MQFSALLEYLISGIVASIWTVALINVFIPLPINSINDYKEILIVVYFPIAYILGIYIDVVSSFLIRRTKEIFRSLNKYRLFNKLGRAFEAFIKFIFGTPKTGSYEHSATILANTPAELVKTMDAYVSRDRIARGMALNSLASALVSLLVVPCEIKLQVFFTCLIFFLLSIAIWRRLRRLSSTFKRVAIKKLIEHKNV